MSRPLHRRVAVLGSTGSIGDSTLSLLEEAERAGSAEVQVTALVAGRNVAKLAEQARRWRPRVAVIQDEACLPDLRDALAGTNVEAAAGSAAVCEAALGAEWVMSAIVGAAGLPPTLAAARAGATVALANKESLVCAGPALLRLAREAGGAVIPVDSEHSAIFQALRPEQAHRVARLVLTASGGPFRCRSLEDMAAVTPAEAVAHPNWSMGAKISVDSATMANKGLETIEAAYLFDMPAERIDVVVHPESIVHSMVEYVDGSTLAQLGPPDMRAPIAFALAWPDRLPWPAPRLDLPALGRLTFEAADEARFPALRLARAALQRGGAAPAVFNAANEVGVAAFLEGRLGFLDIAALTERVLDQLEGEGALHPAGNEPLAAATAADALGRSTAARLSPEFARS